MNADDYYNYDFKLFLKFVNEEVWVSWPLETSTPGKTRYKEINISAVSAMSLESLISKGEDIAKMLLPGTIRDEFQEKWKAYKKIRLCLYYPDSTEINKLLHTPWEYIYLPKEEEIPLSERDNFLGIRSDISIVHCLNRKEESRTGVESLRVKMKYLSWLGASDEDKADDIHIFNDFLDIFPIPSRVFNFSNNDISKPALAEPASVKNAWQTEDLVHVTCHGSGDNFELSGGGLEDTLLDDDGLNVDEVSGLAIDAKAIILLSCNAGNGTNAFSVKLHKAGVPVVIGMTQTILKGAARSFIDGFYSSLATWPGDGLERAVVNGRDTVFEKKGDKWVAGFGVPRLFLNSSDSLLIPKYLLFGSDDLLKSFDNFIAAESKREDLQPDKTQEWQDKLAAWVKQDEDAPKRDWYLVAGPNGSGKSNQIARLLADPNDSLKDKKMICHFCSLNATDPLEFVLSSLVRQLLKHYGDTYKEAVNEVATEKFPLLIRNEDVALSDFVIKPLQKLIDDGKVGDKPIFIIDDLDTKSSVTKRADIDVAPEEETHDNTILGLLLRHRGDLNNIGRFLITVNYDPDEHDILTMEGIYHLTYRQRDSKIDLEIKPPEEQPLVLYVDMIERFDRAKKDLYQLLEGDIPKEINEWPELYDFLRRIIKAREQEHGNLVTKLLSVVTVAYEPLRVNQVAAILGYESDNGELRELLRLLQPFFKDYGEDTKPKLSLYHDRIKNHLLQEKDWWHGQNLNEVHELFIKAFQPICDKSTDVINWAKVTDWQTLAGTNWSTVTKTQPGDDCLATISRYVRHYLVYHTYYSCYYTSWSRKRLSARRMRAKTFLNLICDSRFRNVRLHEVGRRKALNDIWLGLRVINVEYIHTKSKKNHTKARVAFDRLLAANQPGSYHHNKLVELEEKLRNNTAGWEDLFVFLNFDTPQERGWWDE